MNDTATPVRHWGPARPEITGRTEPPFEPTPLPRHGATVRSLATGSNGQIGTVVGHGTVDTAHLIFNPQGAPYPVVLVDLHDSAATIVAWAQHYEVVPQEGTDD